MHHTSPKPDIGAQTHTRPYTLHVRSAIAADLPAIRRLIEQSVWGLNSAHYTAHQLRSALRYLIGADPVMVADGTCYVVELSGSLAGIGGWSRRQARYGRHSVDAAEADLLDADCEPAHIRSFYVHPGHARQGIGRTLLLTCEAAARAEGFTGLELLATRTGLPLYARYGFVALAETDFALPDGIRLPLVRMRKAL